MPMLTRRTALAALALSPFATLTVGAEEPKATEPKKPADDAKWQSLFDGKTLKNWKRADFNGAAEPKVKDGALIIEAGEPISGIVWSGGEIPKINYEIQLEGQRVEGDDFFCALTFPVKDDPCSLVLGGWGGGVTGLSSLNGSDASENETTGYREFEKKKWYRVRLVVLDGRILAWLDDDRIVNVDTSDKRISIRIEVDPCRPLGISTYRTVGALRNMKVRPLSAEEVAKIKTDAEKE
jgi:hypothetical protein